MTNLADAMEVLFRQIHPKFIEDGLPTSQPFRPTRKDNGRLSVDRSALTSASDSFALFIATGSTSTAVYGLTVGECGAEKLPCSADPIESSSTAAANAAHAFVDFNDHSDGQWKNISKRLKRKAIERGQLHPSPSP